ncbi:MAG: hypothetical protein EA406_05535 [Rhodospirillales bacterium]|nr:MAG: hypothetical protein EA406_05535 [Rhodospirillales bacterium]
MRLRALFLGALAGAALLIVIAAPCPAAARCISYTGPAGFTDLRCADGTRGQLFTDATGTTTGWVGSAPVALRKLPSGRAIGRIGDRRLESYTDRFGDVHGRIIDPGLIGAPHPFPHPFRAGSPVDAPRHFTCRTDAAGARRCR